MIPVDWNSGWPESRYGKLFGFGLAAPGFLDFGGGSRGLASALRGSGLRRLFCHFFGIDNRGGRGVLLYRFDPLNTRRLVFIRLACGDDFPVAGLEMEPVLFFPVNENLKFCCHVALLLGLLFNNHNESESLIQADILRAKNLIH
jgi:hypothetical protein